MRLLKKIGSWHTDQWLEFILFASGFLSMINGLVTSLFKDTPYSATDVMWLIRGDIAFFAMVLYLLLKKEKK